MPVGFLSVVSGSCPVPVRFVSGFMSGSCLGCVWVSFRVRVWFPTGFVSGFVSGSCPVRVRVRVRFVS